MTLTGHFGPDPAWHEEYGYGIGSVEGIRVVKYGLSGLLEFKEDRDDFVHQLYWSPDGLLSTLVGLDAQFISGREVFWVRRAVSHEVSVAGGRTVYRICLREEPPALRGLRAGAVPLDAETASLVRAVAAPGVDEHDGLAARARIMAGLGAASREFTEQRAHRRAHRPGFATEVARALSREPGDPTRLDEWAVRLRTSTKTLQRDFEREFGMCFSQWRTRLRLRAARVLLEESHGVVKVAHRVGYASPSAFIQAFTKEYGRTPGTYVRGETDRVAGRQEATARLRA